MSPSALLSVLIKSADEVSIWGTPIPKEMYANFNDCMSRTKSDGPGAKILLLLGVSDQPIATSESAQTGPNRGTVTHHTEYCWLTLARR